MSAQRVLVTGAGGQLGGYLCPALGRAGHEVIGLGRAPAAEVDLAVDITDPAAVESALRETRPDVVIHAAAYTDVDGCELHPERAEAVNHHGARYVADAARAAGAWVLAIGTDFVFAGDAHVPYREDAAVGPISAYGASKLRGEQAVLAADGRFAVARTAWVFGGAGKHFPRTVLTVMRERGTMTVVDDEIGSPTFAGDLAEALVAVLAHRPSGILHLTNEGAVSRFGFARAIARAAGYDPAAIRPTTTAEFLAQHPLPARRPAFSALANTRAAALGVRLPPWEDAVRRYVPRLAAELGGERAA